MDLTFHPGTAVIVGFVAAVRPRRRHRRRRRGGGRVFLAYLLCSSRNVT